MTHSQRARNRRSGANAESRPNLWATLRALPFLALWVASILWETIRPE
jgi:hypothetical protein